MGGFHTGLGRIDEKFDVLVIFRKKCSLRSYMEKTINRPKSVKNLAYTLANIGLNEKIWDSLILFLQAG